MLCHTQMCYIQNGILTVCTVTRWARNLWCVRYRPIACPSPAAPGGVSPSGSGPTPSHPAPAPPPAPASHHTELCKWLHEIPLSEAPHLLLLASSFQL